MVLNWQRDTDQPLQVEAVDLNQRRDLLSAIMKSPGPFFQHRDGRFQSDDQRFDETAYLQVLQSVPVYEARGRVDFAALAQRYLERVD